MRYARRCDITGKGMNEGFCWQDGWFYTASEDDTINKLVEFDWYPDAEVGKLLELACEDGELYFTEWEPSTIEEQGYYYTENGELIELES
jgi:hypothetical protein